MCGIVGMIDFNGPPAAPELVLNMLAAVRHRGPDADGIRLGDVAALGHTRLSIIDPEGGRQPMTNEDRSLWVVFNGEIYNYRELRQQLQAKGHRFATRSDTEVILHAYEEDGAGCVQRFNGQWAFALWDTRRRKLLLSRDRLGIRPLYYVRQAGKLLFASEVKALMVHPDVPREVDPEGLAELFTFWTTLPPRTVFGGVRELPPGHNLTLEEGGIQVRPYWELDYHTPPCETSRDAWAEEILDLLADATRLRLRADVPVGVYVSGGLDSAVTAALTQRCHDAPREAFSIGFEDVEFDESPYQRLVAASLELEHHTIRCSHDDIARVFPEVIRHTERPVLRTAPAPLYLLSRRVRDEGYKVVLTGEGADEMLGGYDIFKEVKIRRFCAAQPKSAFRALLFKRLYPYLPHIQSQSAAYLAAFFRTRPELQEDPLFSHLPRWQLTSRLQRFFAADLRNQLAYFDPYADLLRSLPPAYGSWDPFCRAQYLETTTLLPGYILSSQGDRMAMAHSVEGRFPFLDHRLAERAARMPVRLKMKGLDEKHILKVAAKRLVPADILARTKQPYRAPEAACFFPAPGRTAQFDYVDELLAPARIRDYGIFCPTTVQSLVNKARAGKIIGIKDNMALVGILSTQLLVDQFVRRQPTETAPPPACPATLDGILDMTTETTP